MTGEIKFICFTKITPNLCSTKPSMLIYTPLKLNFSKSRAYTKQIYTTTKYLLIAFFQMLNLIIIVSMTKRKRDTKTLFWLSATVQQSLIQQVPTMDARISAFFFHLLLQVPFLGKFSPKYQNRQFKLKFGT